MKTFLRILAVIVIFFTVILIGLNLYFTDERLQNMIIPKVNEAIGREIEVESMSLTFFRTFPQFGVSIQNMNLPGGTSDEPHVARLDELIVAVRIFPLISGDISLSELQMINPDINYIVYPDQTTNIDFLIETGDEPAEAPQAEQEAMAIAIPHFTLRGANINYDSRPDTTKINLKNLNADISFSFDELIESALTADVESAGFTSGGKTVINNLSLKLQQSSVIDTDREVISITESTLSVRGFDLNLSGDISNWSSDAPSVDLRYSSSSQNFGELLGLVPPEYEEYFSGLETRGSLVLDGSVAGTISAEEIPRFNFRMEVNEGYLKNPDLPEAISDIKLIVDASNELINISDLRATAGENRMEGNMQITDPLEDDASFQLQANGDINLATISSFYPIEEDGIEELRGLLSLKANASGRADQPQNFSIASDFSISDGYIKYRDVPEAIENINAVVQADENLVRIESAALSAAGNTFDMSGDIVKPLDEENRTFDITANLDFDLATIKDFYPIDEDTLKMSGRLNATASLKGKADFNRLENSLRDSRIEFRNGYFSHKSIGKPLEDVTLLATLNGTLLTLEEARFKSGQNNLQMSGNIRNYLGENPLFDVKINGDARLSDVSAYYSLEPWINQMDGSVTLNLTAKGPAGDPQQLELNGLLEVQNASASGDSLALPVTGLNGKLNVTPNSMTLESFTMNYGSSDINIEGRLQNYLGFLREHESEATMPGLTGSYSSKILNMDEMIDWEAETEDEPIPVELPKMVSTITAQVDSLIFFELPVTNVSGRARITPDNIVLEESSARLFNGKASGRMVWNTENPERTNMQFTGSLDSLEASSFFRDMNFLGVESEVHKYLSGNFSADVDYFTEFDVYLNPDPGTTNANGTFGMTKARMKGHPVQMRVSRLLKAPEFENLALDRVNAEYAIEDTLLKFSNFNITSDQIGLSLSGNQHLLSEKIDYNANLILPPKFKNDIASVVSSRAADAMTREDGKIALPLQITGTSDEPRVAPDEKLIENILKDFLKKDVGDAIKKLFGGN